MLNIKGAYGRTYNTWLDAENDWVSGADFKILGGPYCSVRDLVRLVKDFGTIVLLLNKEKHYLHVDPMDKVMGYGN